MHNIRMAVSVAWLGNDGHVAGHRQIRRWRGPQDRPVD